jgi:hypothetical protein
VHVFFHQKADLEKGIKHLIEGIHSQWEIVLIDRFIWWRMSFSLQEWREFTAFPSLEF